MTRATLGLALALVLVFEPTILFAQGGTFRDRLAKVHLDTKIGVELRTGDVVQGRLAEVSDESLAVWVEADEKVRNQFAYAQTMKRRLPYTDIVVIRGPDFVIRPSLTPEPAAALSNLQSQLQHGDALRVQEHTGTTVTGTLEELTANRVTLRLASDSVTIPSDSITRIDLATATKTSHRGWLGAAVGSGVGFAIGYGYVKAACEQPDCLGYEYATTLGVMFGFIGAGLGYLGGRAVKKQNYEWSTVYSKPGFQFGLAPIITTERKGVAVMVSF